MYPCHAVACVILLISSKIKLRCKLISSRLFHNEVTFYQEFVALSCLINFVSFQMYHHSLVGPYDLLLFCKWNSTFDKLEQNKNKQNTNRVYNSCEDSISLNLLLHTMIS